MDEVYPDGMIVMRSCPARTELLREKEAAAFWRRAGLKLPEEAKANLIAPSFWIGPLETLTPYLKGALQQGKRLEVIWLDNAENCKHQLAKIAEFRKLPLLILLNYQGGGRMGYLWTDLMSLLIRYQQQDVPFVIQTVSRRPVPPEIPLWHEFDLNIVSSLQEVEGVDLV